MTAAIAVSGLTKDYGSGAGVFALDLEVQPGEVFGFLGPNGAGKSTTIRMLLDLARPDSGSMQVLGLSPRGDGAQLRSRLGFLPGELALWRSATGMQVLKYLAALQGGVDTAFRDELIERFDVPVHRPIRNLSTGNKQKIGMVQAFMHRPELVILDEPTTGLDPLVQQEFQKLVRETAGDGRTVFLSSHTLSEVERIADRVAVLRGGQLVTVNRVESLKQRAVRRLQVELDAPAAEADFADLDGVRDIQVTGNDVRATVEGHMDALVKRLAEHTVLSISVEEADLEEVFLTFYQADGQSPSATRSQDGRVPTSRQTVGAAAHQFRSES